MDIISIIVIVASSAAVIGVMYNVIREFKKEIKNELDSKLTDIKTDIQEIRDDNRELRNYIFAYMSDRAKRES